MSLRYPAFMQSAASLTETCFPRIPKDRKTLWPILKRIPLPKTLNGAGVFTNIDPLNYPVL